MCFTSLTIASQCHIREAFLISQMFERWHHVWLEVIPFEKKLLLLSCHCECWNFPITLAWLCSLQTTLQRNHCQFDIIVNLTNKSVLEFCNFYNNVDIIILSSCRYYTYIVKKKLCNNITIQIQSLKVTKS